MIKLITVLTGGLTGIITGLLAFITRKVGTAAGSIASFVIITLGLIACINSILNSVLGMIAIPSFISNSVGLFIPINFTAILAAIVSSRICRVAYDLAKFKIIAINTAS